jgi:hypothetical protein
MRNLVEAAVTGACETTCARSVPHDPAFHDLIDVLPIDVLPIDILPTSQERTQRSS